MKLPTVVESYGARPIPQGDNRILGYDATELSAAAEYAGKQMEYIGNKAQAFGGKLKLKKESLDREAEKNKELQDRLTLTRAKGELARVQISLENEFELRNDYENFEIDADIRFNEIKEKYKDSFSNEKYKVSWGEDYSLTSLREFSKLKSLVREKNLAALKDDLMLDYSKNLGLLSKTYDEDKQLDIINSNKDNLKVLEENDIISPLERHKYERDMQKQYALSWVNAQPPDKSFALLSQVKPEVGNIDDMLRIIINLEGGDKTVQDVDGGTVRFGLNSNYNKDIDLANLTYDGAVDVYKKKYVPMAKLSNVPDNMKLIVLDARVDDFSPDVLGISLDEAVRRADGDPSKLIDIRREYYTELAKSNPDKYEPLYNGFMNRLNEIEKASVGGVVNTGTPLDFLDVNQIEKLKQINSARVIDLYGSKPTDELGKDIQFGFIDEYPDEIKNKIYSVFENKLDNDITRQRLKDFSIFPEMFKLGKSGDATYSDFEEKIASLPNDSTDRKVLEKMRDFYTKPDAAARSKIKVQAAKAKLGVRSNLDAMFMNIGYKKDKKTGGFEYARDADVMDNAVNYVEAILDAVEKDPSISEYASKKLATVSNVIDELVNYDDAYKGRDRKRLAKVFNRSPYAVGYQSINLLVKNNPSLNNVTDKARLFSLVDDVSPELTQLYKAGNITGEQLPTAYMEKVVEKLFPDLQGVENKPNIIRTSDGRIIKMPPSVLREKGVGGGDFILKKSYKTTDGGEITDKKITKLANENNVTPRVIVGNLIAQRIIKSE